MTEINPGYSNHSGSTMDGAGNMFAVITQDGPGSGDTVVIIKRCLATSDPTVAASWEEVKRWTEQQDGKPGYGTAEVRKHDGLLVAILSQRTPDGATVTKAHTVEGIAEPWPDTPESGGAVVEAPNGALRIYAVKPFPDAVILDLDPYGIPPSRRVHVRLTISAREARKECLCGSIKAITQAVDVRACAQDWIIPGDGNTLKITGSGINECHVDILGWEY